MTADRQWQEAIEHDPLAPGTIADPERQWRVLRPEQPLHHFVLTAAAAARTAENPFAAEPTTEFWTVLRHADAAEVLSDAVTFSSAQGPGVDRMAQAEEGGVLIFADGQVHLRQRRLTARAFTPRAVERVTPMIQAKVDDLIDGLAQSGEADLVSEVSLPLSLTTILQIMAVPLDRTADFHRWGSAITGALGGDPDAIAAGGQALNDIFGYLQGLIDEIRDAPADAPSQTSKEGVLAALVHASHEGTELSDLEVCQIAMQLIVAGYETTSTALANGVHALCTHPAQRELFERADPEHTRNAVEEVLRFVGPQAGLFRTSTRDVEIGGCPVRANSKVRVAFASANRDETAFDDADELRVDRDPAVLRTHLAFGLGPHACIGGALARAELRIGLQTLFQRIPTLQLVDGGGVRNDSLPTINGFRSLRVTWDPATVRPRQGG